MVITSMNNKYREDLSFHFQLLVSILDKSIACVSSSFHYLHHESSSIYICRSSDIQLHYKNMEKCDSRSLFSISMYHHQFEHK